MTVIFSKTRSRVLAWIMAITFSLAATVVFAAPASAAKPIVVPPDFFSFDVPAGERCEFAMHSLSGGGVFVVKETTDEDGNVIQEHISGKTNAFTFTNLENGKSVTIDSKGFSQTNTYNADGSVDSVSTGQVLYNLLATDVPAGPAFYVVHGRVVFTLTADEVFIVEEVSGRTTDICALLR